jgi:hypothetical protein
MTAIRSRIAASVLAFAIVAAAGWGLARPYLLSYFAEMEQGIVDVFGTPDVASSAWIDVDAGAFHLRAPHGTTITAEPHSDYGAGRITHPTFALSYRFGPGTLGPGASATGYDEIVLLNGHSGVLRRSYVAGTAEPWRVSLYVERGGLWWGAPVSVELHGAFETEYQREMAATVLKSLRAEDLPQNLASVTVSVYDPSAINGIP